jgi:glutaryl-CoA dehydrogenase
VARPLAYPDADILGVTEMLSPTEHARWRGFREFFQAELRPVALEHWNRGRFPLEMLPVLARQGVGEIGHGSDRPLLTGLIQMEFTRADTSFATALGVHSGLVAHAIRALGSSEHQDRLADLLALRSLGAFALTEPDHGSDISRGMQTTATRDGDEWVLEGSKRWIGNGTIAEVILVWARDVEDGQIKGFLVERGTPGLTTTLIENKLAARIVENADIELRGVRIPAANHLPGTRTFSDTNALLCESRVWVAWQAVGQQFAAIDVARAYALERQQFGRPIASFQLIQEQLARMVGNATMSLSLLVQIARVQEAGRLTMDQAALAKASTTLRMRETVALGRAMLGGNGVSVDFEMAKIFADAEGIYSWEGSYEVNALLVGRALTGISAFA